MARTELFVRRQPGGMFSVINETVTTGSIFFVDDATGTDGTGYGRSPDAPVATIDYAVGLCTAEKGDIIYVMPYHTENISAATDLVMDIDGISVIGLGHGRARPILTLDTAAGATVSITGANCRLENLILKSNYTNGVTAGITVGASADGLVIKNIEMEETANTKEFLIGISVAAACHNVIIDGVRFFGVTGGTDSQCIKFVGASNFSVVQNCMLYGDFSGAVIDALTAASTYMTIANNIVSNDDTTAGLSISVHASTTGMMAYNNVFQAKDTVGPAGAAMSYVENYVTNAAGAQGILKPAADS